MKVILNVLKVSAILTTVFFLFSCNFQSDEKLPNNSSSSEQSSVSSNPSSKNSVSSVTFECLSQPPEFLSTRLNGYQIAKKSDFVRSIRGYGQENPTAELTCSVFEFDLNQDQLNDYALLLVSENKNHFRFLILLNQGKGEFSEAIVKDYQSISQPSEAIVYTSMIYKPPGNLGITQREYSPIKPNTSEGKSFMASPAIELWDAIKDNQTNLPLDLELSTLAYCSQVFYWAEEKIETVIVCD